MLKKMLFRIAKSPFMGKVVGRAFQYCPWAIPVKKVYCSKEALAFHHPSPSYANHLILSPRKAIRNLQQLGSEQFVGYFARIMDAAMDICAKHAAYQKGFVLVANGGKKQEVQQVHFHMFTNHQMVNGFSEQTAAEKAVVSNGVLSMQEYSEWETHYVLRPAADDAQDKEPYLCSALHCIHILDEEFDIVNKGYSFLFQYGGQAAEWDRPVFHVVAGKRRR